eukprot:TRINITY_DN64794_c0_g1_i1.p2 TRINITY_DN64794_c0_g1~~TRINITY_DN64794_c0_g1_i1.p2  ORF type:complete len:129 (+),score=27.19 TRINITY_DN64794_c0_g1_i1:148-534(+)
MSDAKNKDKSDDITLHDPIGDPPADDANGPVPDLDLDEDIGDTIERLTNERDDMRDRFMRALADAENARKRSDRDRKEAEQYGGAKLSRDLLQKKNKSKIRKIKRQHKKYTKKKTQLPPKNNYQNQGG